MWRTSHSVADLCIKYTETCTTDNLFDFCGLIASIEKKMCWIRTNITESMFLTVDSVTNVTFGRVFLPETHWNLHNRQFIWLLWLDSFDWKKNVLNSDQYYWKYVFDSWQCDERHIRSRFSARNALKLANRAPESVSIGW